MKDILIKSYNKSALTYEERFKIHQYIKYVKLLKSDLTLNSSNYLIDFGCGTALLLDYLNEQKIEVQYNGIDLSRMMIEIAKEKTANVIVGDISKTPYNDNIADIITSFTVLRIIQEDEVKILKEIFRVLKPTGTLYLSVLAHKVDDSLFKNLNTAGFKIESHILCGQDIGFICKKDAN